MQTDEICPCGRPSALPKGSSVGSYVVLEGRTFTWKDMDGNAYQTYTVK